MSNVNRPTIPAEVADAIEALRSDTFKYTNENILDLLANGLTTDPTVSALCSIPFDILLAALVNGYVREKTEEETVRDMYEGFKEREKWVTLSYGHDYGAGTARRAIEVTLNTLGIKIEGVNA